MLDKKFKKLYALKEISKVKVIDKKSINSIIYERELLSRLKHSLIINLQYAFQDYNNLYLVLDLLTGGDLRYQIGHHQRQYFSEHQTKFFISCIIESLSYIHSKNIIHRDIKPENLILDEKGYLHITDFGIAKFKSKNNKNESSGTPGYMAPEVMKGMNHTGSVDYFAVGVITYELMMGERPYIGKNRKEIKEQMMSRQIYIEEEMIPFGWSEESADFINRLMVRKDFKRLGFYNELEIKNHPWFYDMDFESLVKKKLEAPFLPRMNHDNYDKKYCEEIEKVGFDTNYRYEEYKANEHYQDIFYGFTFYNVDESQIQIYRKPSIKYIQNIQSQKFRIIENLKERESKTISFDNSAKFNKMKKNIVVIRKKRTIDINNNNNNKIQDNNNDTIDVDEDFIHNFDENKSNKSINNFYCNNQNKNSKKKFVTNIHKRIKSNSIGHNFLYFLQKKKLSNLYNKTNSFKDLSNNDSNSINNDNKITGKKNHSINYHKNYYDKNDKFNHEYASSFSNNLYIDLLHRIREKNLNRDNCVNNQIYCINNKNTDKLQKRTIEINQIPKIIRIYNNNYKSLKNNNNENDIFSSIEYNDSISSFNNNDSNKKIDMMKASSNFYIRQKIPCNKVSKITPTNLRNKKILLQTNYNFNRNYNSIKNDKTISNSNRRTHVKKRAKSFSGKGIYDNSQNINNILSPENNYYNKNDSSIKKNAYNEKKILLNANKKIIKAAEIRHNYSYSSFNNKNKIESLIKNLIEPEKPIKNTIPINYKIKSSNTIGNSKISVLHKKIPIPSNLGQKIFHKRMNGYMSKKLRATTNNSFSNSINNNSINNSSVSKNNNNTSINKSLRQQNNSNSNINSKNNYESTSIISNKKKNFKPLLSKNSNFTSILKKLNNFSKIHKKNIGNNFNYLFNKNNNLEIQHKENKSRKFTVKNNLLKNQIKKIGEKKNKEEINETLKNTNKKAQIENKEDFNNILNNNIFTNKKLSNFNYKNNIDSKRKSRGVNFSYPSCNSTTSSGGKINNKY